MIFRMHNVATRHFYTVYQGIKLKTTQQNHIEAWKTCASNGLRMLRFMQRFLQEADPLTAQSRPIFIHTKFCFNSSLMQIKIEHDKGLLKTNQ